MCIEIEARLEASLDLERIQPAPGEELELNLHVSRLGLLEDCLEID